MSRIAAILLAAGSSRRFGDDNKLLADLNGQPILAHAIGNIVPLNFQQMIAIAQPESQAVIQLLKRAEFEVFINKHPEKGLGSSIAKGVQQLNDPDGVVIFLGDMPFVKADTIRTLLKEFNECSDFSIIAPVFQNQRGHPVMFGRKHFDALYNLGENDGARVVIDANLPLLKLVSVEDPGVIQDIDTVDELKRFTSPSA